jgi:hypothetical protein
MKLIPPLHATLAHLGSNSELVQQKIVADWEARA